MGKGYSLSCKKCGYSISSNLGVGFAFPRVYEAVMEDAQNGKLGKTVQSFLTEYPDGALDCDQVLLQCDDCGALGRGLDLSMYKRMEKYMLEKGITTLTIQGEFCAPGIQKNRLKQAKPEWYVFTVRVDGKRVGLKRMLEICEALDMTHVPIEEVNTDLPSHYPTVEALLARADGEYGLEVYLPGITNRFVTVTGDVYRAGSVSRNDEALLTVLDTFMRGANRTEGGSVEPCSYLKDEQVIEHALKSESGEKFKALT